MSNAHTRRYIPKTGDPIRKAAVRPDEERHHFDARRPPEYTGSYGKKTMTYREPLPEDCPPDDAWEITAHCAVYRLVRNNPPTDDDFRSQRAENPHRVFHRVTECQSRGLSVFADQRDAERQTVKNLLTNVNNVNPGE